VVDQSTIVVDERRHRRHSQEKGSAVGVPVDRASPQLQPRPLGDNGPLKENGETTGRNAVHAARPWRADRQSSYQSVSVTSLASVVVLPTYNEIGTILGSLDKLMALELSPDVLVVDDSSPDGTADLVRRFAATQRPGRVALLQRPSKEGLGSAYRDAFAHVLATGRYEVVVQADADGSHPFGRLPAMLSAVARGADLVIGSRYCPGGGDWPLGRRVLSRAANTYARHLLGLHMADTTSGYRAWRTALLERVLKARTAGADGYCYQVQMLDAAVRLGAVVEEVPICFAQRSAGVSKLDVPMVVEGAWACLSVRLGAVKGP
jgi:dolichol-phosphate mannosyltransferase